MPVRADDLLPAIYVRGTHLRRRRRGVASAGAAAALGVLLTLAGAGDGDDQRAGVLAGEPSSTTAADDGSTGGSDPSGNTPVSIGIEVSPAAPRIGELVTFTITVDDPDGEALGCSTFVSDVAQAEVPPPEVAAELDCSWDPDDPGQERPPPPLHRRTTREVTYAGPVGERTISYTAPDAGDCGAEPCPELTEVLTIPLRPADPTKDP